MRGCIKSFGKLNYIGQPKVGKSQEISGMGRMKIFLSKGQKTVGGGGGGGFHPPPSSYRVKIKFQGVLTPGVLGWSRLTGGSP